MKELERCSFTGWPREDIKEEKGGRSCYDLGFGFSVLVGVLHGEFSPLIQTKGSHTSPPNLPPHNNTHTKQVKKTNHFWAEQHLEPYFYHTIVVLIFSWLFWGIDIFFGFGNGRAKPKKGWTRPQQRRFLGQFPPSSGNFHNKPFWWFQNNQTKKNKYEKLHSHSRTQSCPLQPRFIHHNGKSRSSKNPKSDCKHNNIHTQLSIFVKNIWGI